MIKFDNVTISYNDSFIALDKFNLEIKKGEIITLVGESGCGKTTAIRSLIGLLPPSGKIISGDILINDTYTSNLTPKQWQKLRGSTLSMIFQDCGSMLNPIRTIGSQFIEYIIQHEKINKKDAHDKAVKMLENMGLYDGESIMKSIPSNLSGGMRQRVGIAMAMTFNPKLLIADEPTSALDVTIQAQIVSQMIEINKKYDTSILMVTHNLGVAAYMSDKIIVMKDGKIVETGTRDDIINHPKHDYTKHLIKAIPDMKGVRYA